MASAFNTSCVLAIDLGSGGPKVALFSEQGTLIGRASGTISTKLTSDGGGEQDPEEWWRAVSLCVRQIVGQQVVPVEQIVAISCASQWSVTVPVDEHGQHLMNAVHWSDARGAVYTQRLMNGLVKVGGYGAWRLWQWMRLTGGAPVAAGSDALAHMLFIRHERPEIYRRTFKFLEPMDYLNFRLTGRAAASYATIFPYLLTDNRDSANVRYNDGLIAAAGLDAAKLPELRPVGCMLGTMRPAVAQEWGLSADTKVVSGTPDSQAGAVGSGAVRDYEGHVCVGTTAWLSCHVPFKKTNVFDFVATMPSAIHGRNMVAAEQGPAGKCLAVFVDNWLFPSDDLSNQAAPTDVYERIERVASCVPAGSDGLLFLPWLNGAGPPSGDSAMRGGFLNQSLRTGRAEAVRAIMEGVAFNLRWLRMSVERFVGRPFETLNFIGGCARSRLWCQILADVLDRPIRRIADPEMAISRGAAMVALVALGRLTVDAIPALVRVDSTYLPQVENRLLYADLFAEFLSSYKANRHLFGRLNARPTTRPKLA